MAEKVTSLNGGHMACRPNVQMSVPSNLKMSVSPAFWRAMGGDSGGGAERERWRFAASRGVAGYRSGWAGGWRSSAAFGAQRAPSVAVVESVSGCGCLGLDLQEARPAEQPQDGSCGAVSSAVHRAPVGRCATPRAPRPPAAPDPKPRATDTSKLEKN